MSETTLHANARKALLRNARKASKEHMDDVLNWKGLVKVPVDGGRFPLPGYIPYIGCQYFGSRTKGHRILAYALSRNIRPDDVFAERWAKNWHSDDGRTALDRQHESEVRAAMLPFDSGHIPVLCAMLRAIVSQASGAPSGSIYDEIAATNLSKFSFRHGSRTTDSFTSLQRCWEWFSKEEIRLLQPDFILCLGNAVTRIVKGGLAEWKNPGFRLPKLLKAAFPSLQVINRSYRKEPAHKVLSDKRILGFLTEKDRKRQVAHNHTLAEIVERDRYYFPEMFRRMEKQLSVQ